MPQSFASPDDRRIHRTRQSIADALLSLLAERDFSDVVVKDITERSNINRSTFYAHYQDKFDLLEKLVQERLAALADLLRPGPVQGYEPDFDRIDPFYAALFEHLAKHHAFFETMLARPVPGDFPGRMHQVIRESYFARIASIRMDQKLLVPLDILLDYLSASTMGSIRTWLSQQMVFSAHYMALQMTRLSMLGTYRAMGLNEEATRP